MYMIIEKIGFGGGCHWCTEAYFQSLAAVEKVEQGWIASLPPNDTFSEGVIVHYDSDLIPLEILISIHLHTHASTKMHRFRNKYRSAVYAFDNDKLDQSRKIIADCQLNFDEQIITEVLLFKEFKSNTEQFHDYYQKHKEGVFCKRYISPKLQMIENQYSRYLKHRNE